MAKQTVTAFFDDRENADNAVLLLRRYAIPDRDVTISPDAAATGHRDGETAHVSGFWAFLEDLFGGTHDHHAYAEAVRRGGFMVIAHVDEAYLEDVVAVLERHGSVDLNEREGMWRADGWTGRSAVAGDDPPDAVPSRPLDAASPVETERAAASVLATASARRSYCTSSAPADTVPRGPDDVTTREGKPMIVDTQAVNRGKVRVHDHAVAAVGPRATDADRSWTGTGEEFSQIEGSEHGRIAGRGQADDGSPSRVQRARNMDVVGSDGQHIGIIDHVEGTTIRLKRADPASGATPHLIPTDWVHSVDDKVWLKLTAADAKSRWTAA